MEHNNNVMKIFKLVSAAIIAVSLITPLNMARAATPGELQSQYRAVLIELIQLLTEQVRILQAQLVAIMEQQSAPRQDIGLSAIPAVPATETTPTAEDPFSFDIEINGRKTDTIRLPSAPYTKAEYGIVIKAVNKSGNSSACDLSGFADKVGWVQVSFTAQFLEKKVYAVTITCLDRVTNYQSVRIITVDTR